MTKTESALSIEHLTKTYGRARGVSDINLTVQAGEIFGFLGPNGAGKSTTINTVLDLLRPDEGRIKLFGLDNRRDGLKIRHRIGYLAGDMETDPSLNGQQYLEFVKNSYGDVDDDYVKQLTRRLGCDLKRKIRHLSRGNRQKIGLVAALMHQPDLLILDEPTSGLDPLIQNQFNQILKEHQQAGKT
ncbi:MAG TPA: ABC transporter ATP-binding protein, partial [Candidatus Saccharimonadales bacterium]|nr:ABC transporter ATP-binding protein [Candidatus Saccharimonadales bacterium]